MSRQRKITNPTIFAGWIIVRDMGLIMGLVVVVALTLGDSAQVKATAILGGFAIAAGWTWLDVQVEGHSLAYDNERERARRRGEASRLQEQEARMLRYNSIVRHVPVPGKGGQSFNVEGPPNFVAAVEQVLDELQQWAPPAYTEALAYLPMARFDPDRLRRENPAGAFARSDGLFAIDGSHYGSFRHIFLHEVGHQVSYAEDGDFSEQSAEHYAGIVEFALQRGHQAFPCSGSFALVNKATGKCLDLSNWDNWNGARIQQWWLHGSANQLWEAHHARGLYFSLRSRHGGRCIDVKDQLYSDGAEVQLWDYWGGPGQEWLLGQQLDGSWSMTSRLSGKCLDAGWGDHDGAPVVQWAWHGGDNQRWWINPRE